jgi:hypothetical protein
VQVELSPADLSQLDEIGALRIEGALDSGQLARLSEYSDTIGRGRPGERIADLQALGWLLDEGAAGDFAKAAMGPAARPVRAILFDKTPVNNWALGWHQDRTIAVQDRLEMPGFANWNVKAGVHHVEPPFDIIEHMVTARIHIDAVDEQNAPLLIAPGSHCLGKIAEADVEVVVRRCGEVASLAKAGDIWLYRTAIVHASKRAQGDKRRRVLQVDFSADELPGNLRWVG